MHVSNRKLLDLVNAREPLILLYLDILEFCSTFVLYLQSEVKMTNPQILPTPRQIDYAISIARNLNERVPYALSNDRAALSKWISERKAKLGQKPISKTATSRQVGYAEKIAMRKRTHVPRECFQDAGLMSRWIDRNR